MGFGDKGVKEKNREKAAIDKLKAEQATEDATWKENNKNINAKEKRKEDKMETAEEKARRKQELKELEAAEEEEIGKMKGAKKKNPTKVTQAEVARNMAMQAALAAASGGKKKSKAVVPQPKLEPNLNRETDLVEATGIDAALAALEVDDKAGGGKMTFKKFEAENAERIKAENKGLKHSQINEAIWKAWDRSPDNPKNQPQ